MKNPKTYYVSISTLYVDGDSHPVLDGMTGNHYLKVIAPDFDTALELINKETGENYLTIFPEDTFNEYFYPAGNFKTVSSGE